MLSLLVNEILRTSEKHVPRTLMIGLTPMLKINKGSILIRHSIIQRNVVPNIKAKALFLI